MPETIRQSTVAVAFTLTLIAIIATPLTLRYHIFRSVSFEMTNADLFQPNKRLSTVWCEAVEIESTDQENFTAHLFGSYPPPSVAKVEGKKVIRSQRLLLPKGAREYWGFNLQSGSAVTVSVCARIPGAVFSVIRGQEQLRACLEEYRVRAEQNAESEESFESGGQSAALSSSMSSSEGVFVNESQNSFMCHYALLHVALRSSYRCSSQAKLRRTRETRAKNIVTYNIHHSDNYYFMYSSDSLVDILPNEINVKYTFERASYDYSQSKWNCTAAHRCVLPFSFASSDNVILEIELDDNDDDEESHRHNQLHVQKLTTACVPRRSVYFLFYFAFALFILLCAFQ